MVASSSRFSPPDRGRGFGSTPPSGGRGRGSPLSLYNELGPISDGSSRERAAWSFALERNPEQINYVVQRFGNSPIWIRTTITEARVYSRQGYPVFDGANGRRIEQHEWAAPLPSTVGDDPFYEQNEGIEDQRDRLTSRNPEQERIERNLATTKSSAPSTPTKKGLTPKGTPTRGSQGTPQGRGPGSCDRRDPPSENAGTGIGAS